MVGQDSVNGANRGVGKGIVLSITTNSFTFLVLDERLKGTITKPAGQPIDLFFGQIHQIVNSRDPDYIDYSWSAEITYPNLSNYIDKNSPSMGRIGDEVYQYVQGLQISPA